MIDALTASPVQPPQGAAADWTVEQRWNDYTPAEHALWDRLYRRQAEQLPGRVTTDWIAAIRSASAAVLSVAVRSSAA